MQGGNQEHKRQVRIHINFWNADGEIASKLIVDELYQISKFKIDRYPDKKDTRYSVIVKLRQ